MWLVRLWTWPPSQPPAQAVCSAYHTKELQRRPDMSTDPSNEKPSPKDANPAPAGRDAFAQVIEPYRRQIKAYCYRMVGSLHEAEDLTQETFLKAWRAFDGFEARGSLKAWLYKIATRVCLDAIRQKKRLRRQWYLGRDAIRAFFEAVWRQYGRFRMLRTAANRQPAFVLYTENRTDGTWAAHSIHLLTLDYNSISKLTLFMKPMSPGLVKAFQFPLVMND